MSSYLYKSSFCLYIIGWRRSQDGFSAFYLTVPQKAKLPQLSNDNSTSNSEDEESASEDAVQSRAEPPKFDNDTEFVARYKVSFGQNDNVLTRMSSIRNDFDLGVGFPNFTEVSTLIEAMDENELLFRIEVEIFECESTVKQGSIYNEAQNAPNIAARLLAKMYHEKLNCDAVIASNYVNQQNIEKTRHFKVHKCILTAASPVFNTFFKHNSKENATSSIVMNQWNLDIVIAMIKFLYLGKIELEHGDEINYEEAADGGTEDDEFDGGLGDLSLECDVIESDDSKVDVQEEIKCEEDEEESEESSILGIPSSPAAAAAATSSFKKSESVNADLNELKLNCPEDAQKLFGLFQIAECYEIEELIIACCHKLRSYITVQTCCIFLIYLDKYTHLSEIKSIKHCILDFIVANIKKIKLSNGYLYLLQNKPALLDELIDKITQNS